MWAIVDRAENSSRRRWFQFNFATFLLVVAGAAIGIQWWAEWDSVSILLVRLGIPLAFLITGWFVIRRL
jgi:hypothetical protein